MGVTKDNVAIQIDSVLYIQIEDPVKASYNVENYELSIVSLAQTSLRSQIGKLSLDESFSSRE